MIWWENCNKEKKITYYFLRDSLNPVGEKKQEYYSENKIDSKLPPAQCWERGRKKPFSDAHKLEELTTMEALDWAVNQKTKDTGHESWA